MFRESLLESSPETRKRKRWPMAAAFTTEAIVAAVLILIPLITTAVIPVSAHVSILPPLGIVHAASHEASGHSGSTGPHMTRSVVTLVNTNHNTISFPTLSPATNSGEDRQLAVGNPNGLPDLGIGDDRSTPALQPRGRRIVKVSHLDEAQLLKRVQPVYPPIAIVTHTEGDVQLHALIARDGTIQSLTVVSGHPILATAAVDAVKQWKYRPYFLNGQPVEVETFITVSFKRIRD